MFIYIIKRLLLLIPTLFIIIAINFFIIQLSPGGPVELMTSKLSNTINGESSTGTKALGNYKASLGMDEELIAKLQKMYGFDKPILTRFFIMLKNYLVFDFGSSFYRDTKVIDIIKEKLPVSISLGIFSTAIIYLISIPLGIFKAAKNGTRFDNYSSFIVIFLHSIPSFLFAILLIVLFASGNFLNIFPLKGLISENFYDLDMFGKIKDFLWHLILPVFCIVISSFASLTLLVKNSFLDEMQKSYVMLARSKGASLNRVLYFHIFRNAMLLVISLFPATFVAMFFSSNLLIEIVFSLDGLGLLGYDSLINRDYPIVFSTLYIFTLIGLIVGIVSDILYTIIDPRINFGKNK